MSAVVRERDGQIVRGEVVEGAAMVDLPWAEWRSPLFREINLGGLRVDVGRNRLHIFDGDEEVGEAGAEAVRWLGNEVDYPTNFVTKLPVSLQAQIINERIQSAKDREVLLVQEDDVVTNFIRRNVGVLPYRETCELAWDTLSLAIPGASIDHARIGDSGLALRLLAPVEQPVTRAVGDTLALGVQVLQNYGTTTQVGLYVRRLTCLNGMTNDTQAFQWQRRGETGPEFQRQWLQNGIIGALESYEQLLDRARRMAETRLEGDPREALQARARAAGIPARHFESLWNAWQQEEDRSEWGVANAMTRLATHTALPGDLSHRLQEAAGQWTHNFDVVTARLPRPIAQSVGAHIIEADE